MASLLSNETTALPDRPQPAIRQGDKLYVTELSTAPTKSRHHFAGEVTGISGDVVRLDGHDFLYEESSGNFMRKSRCSQRILRLDNAMVFYVLPTDCDIEGLHHKRDGTALIITDGGSFEFVDPRYSGR
jgi:hypothetical protein